MAMSVPRFAFRRVAKQAGDVRVALDIRMTGEIEIAPVGFRLAGESMFQIFVSFGSCKRWQFKLLRGYLIASFSKTWAVIKDCGAPDSATFDQARVSPGFFGFQPARSANAYEIEPMLFYLETADPARLLDQRIQTGFDWRLEVGDPSTDTADQMVMRILDGLEVGHGHSEIKFPQIALRDQHAQIAIDSPQAQSREVTLHQLVDLVRRQVAAMPLDHLEDRLPLFCVSDIHRKVPDKPILVRLHYIVNNRNYY